MRRWLAGALVVTAGFLASPGAVPVYDGVGQPDEPYKRVGSSNAPQPVSVTVEVQDGASAALRLQSTEKGPQVLLDLAPGALKATGPFTATATPIAPDGTPPRGVFDGNVYRIVATGGASVDADIAQGFLFLRAEVMTDPAPVVIYRPGPGQPWAEQRTNLSGRDILSTPFRKLGDYGLIRLPDAEPLDSAGGLSTGRVVILLGGVALLLVITVLVLRRPRVED